MNNKFSLASIIGIVLVAIKWIAIPSFGIATWAQLRSNNLDDHQWKLWITDWLFWFMVVASLAAAADPGQYLRRTARRRGVEEARSNHAVHAFGLLTQCFRPKRAMDAKIHEARECLLRAAMYELCSKLDMPEDALRVNLLVAMPPSQFRVAARSRPGSPMAEYDMRPGSAVTDAMQKNLVAVIDDTTTLSAGDRRSYKSVVAVPIALGKRAFGAISADTAARAAFRGKAEIVDKILRPYAAAILLTLPANATAYDCPDKHE